MAKQQKEDLPVFDDFTEDTLFDQLEEEEEGAAGSQDDDDDNDDDDATKNQNQDQDDDQDDDDDKGGKGDDQDDDDDDDDSSDNDDDDDSKSKKPKASAKDDDDDQDDDDDEPSDETFWTDVEKLTGRNVEVDYGDVDPESAEGAAMREEALVQSAINDHLDYLAKIYPREFRALEHAANGGQMEDLYNPAEPDYSKMEMPEKDEEFQRSFMKSYYEKKGFNATKAKRMVETDEDSDEGLYKAAKEALKELATGQEKERNQKMKQQQQINEQNRRADMQMIGTVENIVQGGKLNKFTVPVKEREQFHQFALQHMQRNPAGGYMFVTPVDPRNLETQLQEMYFAYKGGDLSKIVQREVKTEGARKLRRRAQQSNKRKTGADDTDTKRQQRRGSLPTMDDYNE